VQIFERENLMTNLGVEIGERRRALGLRQIDLADLAGASERFVRELEHGKASVRMDKVVAVLDALGLELSTSARRP
jgi:HTH-type transcriptional regulator/antitoxin HipB